MNIPNALGYTRIIAAPFVAIGIYLWPGSIMMAGIFFVVAATDFLDGFFASALNQRTAFNAWLDPLADKIFIGCCGIALILNGTILWQLILLLCLREVFVVIFLWPQRRLVVRARLFGKTKMLFEVLGIWFGVLGYSVLANYLLAIAIFFSYISFREYLLYIKNIHPLIFWDRFLIDFLEEGAKKAYRVLENVFIHRFCRKYLDK